MTDRFFDDFSLGETFETAGATIGESAILDFALRYDPQPFHLDLEAAQAGPYGGLIASGFQTLAMAFRIFHGEKIINACSMGSPGLDELRWLKPVRPGDTIRVRTRVKEMRPSASKPDRGILLMDYEVLNQKDEAVLTFTGIHILARHTRAAETES